MIILGLDPSLSSCGWGIVRAEGNRLAHVANGQISTLSRGSLDESPSFAPNGALLIYAGRDRGQGVLATVSVDGQVSARLKSDQGEVREPVWGPFAN